MRHAAMLLAAMSAFACPRADARIAPHVTLRGLARDASDVVVVAPVEELDRFGRSAASPCDPAGWRVLRSLAGSYAEGDLVELDLAGILFDERLRLAPGCGTEGPGWRRREPPRECLVFLAEGDDAAPRRIETWGIRCLDSGGATLRPTTWEQPGPTFLAADDDGPSWPGLLCDVEERVRQAADEPPPPR